MDLETQKVIVKATLVMATLAAISYGEVTRADPYLLIGAGKSTFGVTKTGSGGSGCGSWNECGLPYDEQRQSTAGQIAIGGYLYPWLGVEFGYHDFGNASAWAVFHGGGDPYLGCQTNCTPTYEATIRAKAHAWSLSLLPTYRYKRLGVFSRVGIDYAQMNTEVHSINRGPCVNPGNCVYAMQSTDQTQMRDMHESHLGAVYGAGLLWETRKGEGFTFEYANYGGLRNSKGGRFEGMETRTINYRVSF